MNEPYWRIKSAEQDTTCSNDPAHLIGKHDYYFVIEKDKKFPSICIECFMEYCHSYISTLKGKVNEYENIIGKCQMKKEEKED